MGQDVLSEIVDIQVEGLERQVQQLQNELERQHFHREDLSQRARDSVQGKADLQLRHQQLEYTHKIQVTALLWSGYSFRKWVADQLVCQLPIRIPPVLAAKHI